MTDGAKVYGSDGGFPTPTTIPTGQACRTFTIPASAEWLSLFMGALEPLTLWYNWYIPEGGIDRETAAYIMLTILESYQETSDCTVVPAPYWDEASGDDADDEMGALDQIWYGEIVESMALVAEDVSLTFLDEIGIWAIAAFIAYAGLPHAAIAFVPVARKFVLYFKMTPTGAIVNILADFLHIAGIDTYSAEDKIGSVLVTMPDDATTLYVEHSGTANPDAGDSPDMRVIRSRLSETDFADPAYRYDFDCDCIQYSPDGGTTWNDAPGSDFRHAPAFRLPPRGGSDIQCTAAANAEKWLQDYIESVISLMDAGATITAVVNELLRFLALIFGIVVGELISLILEVAGVIFSFGAAALTLAFTSDQWPLLLCAIYCNMDTAGQVSAPKFAALEAQVTHDLNATAAIVVNAILSTQGEVGVSNAGAIGTATADCSGCSCEWCYEWDFAVSDGGWTMRSDIGFTVGHYAAGVGWVSDQHEDSCSSHAYLYIQRNISGGAANISHVEYTYGSTQNPGGTGFFDQNVGTSIIQRTNMPAPSANVSAADMTPVSITDIDHIWNNCGQSGGFTLVKVVVKGFGDMPTFAGGAEC